LLLISITGRTKAAAPYREAKKFLKKLTRYTALNQVPVSWRRLKH